MPIYQSRGQDTGKMTSVDISYLKLIKYTKSLLKVKCTFAFGVGHDAERWPSQRSEDRHRKANAGANDIHI